MRMLVPLACVIAVVEAWIAVVLAFGHSDIDTDFRVAWRRIYLDNSWRLRWMEDRLGCCGFESALDMPSSKACASDLVHGRTDGCLSPLRRHYAHYSEVAVEWTLVILLIQTVALVVGTAIYCRFSNGSTWILEDSDEELIAAEGNTGGGIAEDQATAEATAPQPTAAAQE
ncbi:hypothetical protein GGI04_000690 [Coemansia thaxteri]|nr:hypothetical protein GGI04_000690 [Coemansia thaxteri]KAJ2473714.1 hypothetical protein GGI02_000640 [Coemansia sp. RSA 2322]